MSKWLNSVNLNIANKILLIVGVPLFLLTSLFAGHIFITVVGLIIGVICAGDLTKSARNEGTNPQWAFFIGMWFSFVGWFFYSVYLWLRRRGERDVIFWVVTVVMGIVFIFVCILVAGYFAMNAAPQAIQIQHFEVPTPLPTLKLAK